MLHSQAKQSSLTESAAANLHECQLTTTGPSHHDLQTGSDEGQPAGSSPPWGCEACAARICVGCVDIGIIRGDRHHRRQGRRPGRRGPDHPPRHRRESRHPIRAPPGPGRRVGGVRLQGRFPWCFNRAVEDTARLVLWTEGASPPDELICFSSPEHPKTLRAPHHPRGRAPRWPIDSLPHPRSPRPAGQLPPRGPPLLHRAPCRGHLADQVHQCVISGA